MTLPAQAPDWAAALVESLFAAGFTPGEEVQGGMGGYSVAYTRDDCTVIVGGDRGDFDVSLNLPDPRCGRDDPRRTTMALEDYVAAARGDADATLLMSSARNEESTRWLVRRVELPQPLTLDEARLSRVGELQRQRARALFGQPEDEPLDQIRSWFADMGYDVVTHAEPPPRAESTRVRDSPRFSHWCDLHPGPRWYGGGWSDEEAIRSARMRWRIEQEGPDPLSQLP